jgi:hypothetical protein
MSLFLEPLTKLPFGTQLSRLLRSWPSIILPQRQGRSSFIIHLKAFPLRSEHIHTARDFTAGTFKGRTLSGPHHLQTRTYSLYLDDGQSNFTFYVGPTPPIVTSASTPVVPSTISATLQQSPPASATNTEQVCKERVGFNFEDCGFNFKWFWKWLSNY